MPNPETLTHRIEAAQLAQQHGPQPFVYPKPSKWRRRGQTALLMALAAVPILLLLVGLLQSLGIAVLFAISLTAKLLLVGVVCVLWYSMFHLLMWWLIENC